MKSIYLFGCFWNSSERRYQLKKKRQLNAVDEVGIVSGSLEEKKGSFLKLTFSAGGGKHMFLPV